MGGRVPGARNYGADSPPHPAADDTRHAGTARRDGPGYASAADGAVYDNRAAARATRGCIRTTGSGRRPDDLAPGAD